MKKVVFRLDTGFSGADCWVEWEYPDNVTDEELQEDLEDWLNCQIDYYYVVKE